MSRSRLPDVPEHVRRRMSRTHGRDTAPELEVRRLLHGRGRRYRVNYRPLSGLRRTVDIAFTRHRLAVLIDGCFWHGCPIHYVEPKTRTDFWRTKIAGNLARDAETDQRLRDAGWIVLRFWEHEDPAGVVTAIEGELEALLGPEHTRRSSCPSEVPRAAPSQSRIDSA